MTSSLPSFTTGSVHPSWKIGIVRSIWHDELTKKMMQDAQAALMDAGIGSQNIIMVDAPGTFEIPLACKALIEQKKVDGIIALAVILEGRTSHAGMIVSAASQALMDLQCQNNIPIINELIHTSDEKIAEERASMVGAVGAKTLLHALHLHAKIRE